MPHRRCIIHEWYSFTSRPIAARLWMFGINFTHFKLFIATVCDKKEYFFVGTYMFLSNIYLCMLSHLNLLWSSLSAYPRELKSHDLFPFLSCKSKLITRWNDGWPLKHVDPSRNVTEVLAISNAQHFDTLIHNGISLRVPA